MTKRTTTVRSVASTSTIDWPMLTILVIQMQEHMAKLNALGLEGAAAKELESMTRCCDEVCEKFLAEADRVDPEKVK